MKPIDNGVGVLGFGHGFARKSGFGYRHLAAIKVQPILAKWWRHVALLSIVVIAELITRPLNTT